MYNKYLIKYFIYFRLDLIIFKLIKVYKNHKINNTQNLKKI